MQNVALVSQNPLEQIIVFEVETKWQQDVRQA